MALIERTTTVNDITELRDGLEDLLPIIIQFQPLMDRLSHKIRH